MATQEHEALVKALRDAADFYSRERPRATLCELETEIGQNECEAIAKRMDHAADMLEALSAPAVTVTEEMVERAAEVIAGDTAPVSFCRHMARIALERALKSTTPLGSPTG